MSAFKQVPAAMIGPALLAWYKMIHYQISDPGPIEVGRAEAAILAQEIVQSVSAYLTRDQLISLVEEHSPAPHALQPAAGGFREQGQVEIYTHHVEGAPGCCVGIGGRIVCVRVAQ